MSKPLGTLIRLLIIAISTFCLLIVFPGVGAYADCSHPWCCEFWGQHMCVSQIIIDAGCWYVPTHGLACSDGKPRAELGMWAACTAAPGVSCPAGEASAYCDIWSQHCEQCWCNGGSGNGCFPSGTEIKTGAGEVREIQDLSIGDPVVSYNLNTGEEEPATVEDIHQVEREGYYQIQVRDLETGEIKSLEVTGEHPLYALQQEDLDQSQSQSLIERVVGVIKGLISAIIDLVR